MVVGEGEGLLPWKLGGESVGVGAGVAAEGAGASLDGQLLGEREGEEGVHLVMDGVDEGLVDAMIDDLEEAVGGAGGSNLGDGRGGGCSVAVEESGEVYGWVRELVLGGVGQVLLRPEEFRWEIGVVLEERGKIHFIFGLVD